MMFNYKLLCTNLIYLFLILNNNKSLINILIYLLIKLAILYDGMIHNFITLKIITKWYFKYIFSLLISYIFP